MKKSKKARKVNLRKKRKREKARIRNAIHRQRKKEKALRKQKEAQEEAARRAELIAQGIDPDALKFKLPKREESDTFLLEDFLRSFHLDKYKFYDEYTIYEQPFIPEKEEKKFIPSRLSSIETFLDDMKANAHLTSDTEVEPVHSIISFTFYSDMSEQQKDYYIWWRQNARQGIYLEADYSYFHLYLVELLNMIMFDDAQETLDHMIETLKVLQERFELTDRGKQTFSNWLYDFAFYHDLDLKQLSFSILPYLSPKEKALVYVEEFAKEKPMKFPFEFIKNFISFEIPQKSKYYQEYPDNAKELFTNVFYILDEIGKRDSDKSFLEAHSSFNHPVPIHITPFEAAVVDPYSYDGSLQPYTHLSYSYIRRYMSEVIRYTENAVRKILRLPGRFRNFILDDDTMRIIDRFVQNRHTMNQLTIDITKTDQDIGESFIYETDTGKKIDLNLEELAELRKDSEAVQRMLAVEEQLKQAERDYTDELTRTLSALFIYHKEYQKYLYELSQMEWKVDEPKLNQDQIEIINEEAARFLDEPLILLNEEIYSINDLYLKNLTQMYEDIENFSFLKPMEETEENSSIRPEIIQFMSSLSPWQRSAFSIILEEDNPIPKLEEIANAQMSLMEILIDDINDQALLNLNDIIIDMYGEKPEISQEYREDIKHVLELEA